MPEPKQQEIATALVDADASPLMRGVEELQQREAALKERRMNALLDEEEEMAQLAAAIAQSERDEQNELIARLQEEPGPPSC